MLQAEGPETENACVRLVWAQLLLAFRYISLGGSLVLALDTRPYDWVVDIIAVLTRSFEPTSIKVIQPYNHNTGRPIAYIVCQGYGSSESGGLRNLFISRLSEALRSGNSKMMFICRSRRSRYQIHHFRSSSAHFRGHRRDDTQDARAGGHSSDTSDTDLAPPV